MKTRIIKNWRTSLLGVFLLILSVTMLWMKIIAAGEFVALLPTIIGLLCVRDNVFKKAAR